MNIWVKWIKCFTAKPVSLLTENPQQLQSSSLPSPVGPQVCPICWLSLAENDSGIASGWF